MVYLQEDGGDVPSEDNLDDAVVVVERQEVRMAHHQCGPSIAESKRGVASISVVQPGEVIHDGMLHLFGHWNGRNEELSFEREMGRHRQPAGPLSENWLNLMPGRLIRLRPNRMQRMAQPKARLLRHWGLTVYM